MPTGMDVKDKLRAAGMTAPRRQKPQNGPERAQEAREDPQPDSSDAPGQTPQETTPETMYTFYRRIAGLDPKKLRAALDNLMREEPEALRRLAKMAPGIDLPADATERIIHATLVQMMPGTDPLIPHESECECPECDPSKYQGRCEKLDLHPTIGNCGRETGHDGACLAEESFLDETIADVKIDGVDVCHPDGSPKSDEEMRRELAGDPEPPELTSAELTAETVARRVLRLLGVDQDDVDSLPGDEVESHVVAEISKAAKGKTEIHPDVDRGTSDFIGLEHRGGEPVYFRTTNSMKDDADVIGETSALGGTLSRGTSRASLVRALKKAREEWLRTELGFLALGESPQEPVGDDPAGGEEPATETPDPEPDDGQTQPEAPPEQRYAVWVGADGEEHADTICQVTANDHAAAIVLAATTLRVNADLCHVRKLAEDESVAPKTRAPAKVGSLNDARERSRALVLEADAIEDRIKIKQGELTELRADLKEKDKALRAIWRDAATPFLFED